MEGFRDSRSTMIFRGIVIPVVLLCLALYSLQSWTVWLPARRLGGRIGGLTSLTSNHFVIGIVLVKLGFAGAMHSWYLLANLRRTE